MFKKKDVKMTVEEREVCSAKKMQMEPDMNALGMNAMGMNVTGMNGMNIGSNGTNIGMTSIGRGNGVGFPARFFLPQDQLAVQRVYKIASNWTKAD